jgi:hypothetical protein
MKNRRSRPKMAGNGDPIYLGRPETCNMLTQTSWSGEFDVRHLGNKAVGSAVRGISFNIHAVLLASEMPLPG